MENIFVSYSHKDEKWKDKVVTHLRVLEKQGILDVWDDRRISGGDDWFPAIEKAINESVVAILLITADFLISNFILKEEVPRLLTRREREGMRFIPLIVRPCAWDKVDWMNKIQARPIDGRPLSGGTEYQVDKDLADLTKEIAELISKTAIASSPKALTPVPPDKITLSKLPMTGSELYGRHQELALLDAAWADPSKHIICFSAMGGAGKTSLIKRWLNNMAQDNYRGAERVYAWSFYSQGAEEGKQASADEFIHHALMWFGYDGPMDISVWEKGEKLADLIRQRRTLLIMDGLEPLQYPPGAMHGRLKDQGLECLLRNLAASNNGLCVITTRLFVGDLADFQSTVTDIPLDELSDEAGSQLLRAMGVQGSEEELTRASREFKGHALALTLLGSYLATVHGGEIRKRDLIARLTEDEEKGGHAKRVMESYATWLAGSPELDILFLMGLFDRPAPDGAMEVLRKRPVIKGLTEKVVNLSESNLKFAVKHLRALCLLAQTDDKQSDILDCHPLVREYFGDRLKRKHPVSWKKAHGRLYEFFKTQAPDLPDTLEEMSPLFAAVAHGCAAGMHRETLLEVFLKRISRFDDAYIAHKLGAFGAALSSISHFFGKPWNSPVAGLVERSNSYVLGIAGFCLRALGRLKEANEPMQASMEMAIDQGDWGNAVKGAINLSELSLIMGEVDKAVELGKKSVEYAIQHKEVFMKMASFSIYANSLYQAGRIEEAEKIFIDAEALQKKRNPEHPYLSSILGFLYCDLILEKGNYEEVLQRTEKVLEWHNEKTPLLSNAAYNLSRGRAYLQKTVKDGRKDYSKVEEYLNKAVDNLQRANTQYLIPPGLLTRSDFFRITGSFDKAKRDLDEVMILCTRSGMKLHEADCHLEYARLHLAEKEKDEAKKQLAIAKKMIEEMRYHRRDHEVNELGKLLE